MPQIDIVAVGASAGGVEMLKKLIGIMPSSFEPPILIVQHFPETATSVLPNILECVNAIPAKHPIDGEKIQSHQIYAAPPGRHMIVRDGRIRLVRGPKENANRPAIDPLFRSAALCYGSHLAAVLLSGLLDDGTVGMSTVKESGGLTIVQDPDEAPYPDMIQNAMNEVQMDHILNLDGIGCLLSEIANPDLSPESCYLKDADKDPIEMSLKELEQIERNGRVTALTCPECHGTLFEFQESGVPHYRCRVGHAYAGENLLNAQENFLEAAIWTALRALEENNELLARLGMRAKTGGRPRSEAFFQKKQRENEKQIAVLKNALGIELASLESK